MSKEQDQKLLVLVKHITVKAMQHYPRILKNQEDEVESAALLAVGQAVQVCKCLQNDRPTYSPVAPIYAYSRLVRELIRSGVLPVRMRDGFAFTNWEGDSPAPDQNPEQKMSMIENLNNAIAGMTSEERLLLYELWVEGSTEKDIAEDMGISIVAVHRRAKALLEFLIRKLAL